MEGDDRQASIRALRAGLDLGLTHIDTAELYGAGRVETLVAEAIAGRRDEVFLVSKVLPSNATRRGTLRACEQSLKRLRVERLDCYLLHWPGENPLEGTLEAFFELQERGLIRSFGLSNCDERVLEHAWSITGPGRIACNQVLYHLGQRAVEHAVIPWCEARGVAVVGYTPFGGSRFPPSGAKGNALGEVARKHGVTPRQIALAFLTRRPSLFAIPKASDAEHVRQNAQGFPVELDAGDLARLESAFPLSRRRSGVPML